ncbi:DUF736 family protein [Leptospira noguchii]|uniref:DUF736 family protein n=1 Tax=Leptospira noguchii TaxID=28182 RepID=UPI000328668E|nr:DUF736 family protein [Leptospira noguchii]EMS89718.1 PF05284 family protein [Leptospira noguchii str. Cascata]
MSKTLGFMEERSDKEGKKFFNLEINIPFGPKMEFFVTPNSKKNSPETQSSNPPDYLVYYARNQVGAAWKKTSQNSSQEYLSCEIVAPLSAQGKLNFAFFPDRETPGRYNVSYSEPKKEKSSEKPTEEKLPNKDEVPY